MARNSINGRHLRTGISGRNGDNRHARLIGGKSRRCRLTSTFFLQRKTYRFRHADRASSAHSDHGINLVLDSARKRLIDLIVRYVRHDRLVDRHQPVAQCGLYAGHLAAAPEGAGCAKHQPPPVIALGRFTQLRNGAGTKDDFLGKAGVMKLIHQDIDV